MGKDKKAKEAAKRQRIAAKQEKKSIKTEKKAVQKSKSANADDSDNEDVDLDAILADYARKQEQFLTITETATSPPSARSSSTLIANPSNDNEIFLFGGEYYNGSLVKFFNELYVYNIRHDTWKSVTSPNSPLPRSGHAWTVHGNSKIVYLFGGEFSSPKQGTFYHYNDLWRLEPFSREWTKLESKKSSGPPARSGHRMTYFKQYIVLFGGFQDTSMTTKYLNDLWLYDTSTLTWHTPSLPPASQRPDARSSFTFLPHEQGAALYSGYSRVKTAATKISSSRPGKTGSQHQQMTLKPLVHQDAWFLRITLPSPSVAQNDPPTVRWERRKRPVNAPNPPRAGATQAYHKGRGIMFGGVHDVEASEEGIESEFFNTLSVWNVERNRYFTLGLRRPKQGQKRAAQGGGEPHRSRKAGGRAKADEEELLRNLASLEKNLITESADGTNRNSKSENSELSASASIPHGENEDDSDDDDTQIEKPTLWDFPHPRFNAQLAVQHDVLYIYGGTFEKGDREYTFDEMYAIDLGKLDGVKEVFKREIDWAASDEEEEEEEDDDDEDDKEKDEEEEEDEGEGSVEDGDEEQGGAGRKIGGMNTATIARDSGKEPSAPIDDLTTALNDTAFNDEPSTAEGSAFDDNLPHPRPFESLRDFFARTSMTWQELILEDLKRGRDSITVNKSIKEVRKIAFERAEEKWWDCREEIQSLEDEQEAAGIGEVINLDDKAAQGAVGGAGRRR